MIFIEYVKKVIEENQNTLLKIDSKSVELLTDKVIRSRKIFLAGVGRSGFMAKAFAMRLMHLGFETYVVGETNTPSIENDDLLIIASGSGETATMVVIAEKVKKIGASLIVITTFSQSTIGKIADIAIKIDAPTPKLEKLNNIKSIQPLGSLFEQTLLLLFDILILILMKKKNINSDTMFKRHSNLE